MTTAEMQRAFRDGGPLSRLTAAMMLFFNMDEHLPFLAARTYTGHNLTQKADGWLLVMKAERGGKPQVAFAAGDHPEECYLVAAHSILFNLTLWKPDKYRTMRSDKM